MDVKFTMVISEDIARKMSYIGKSRIKEIEWACKEYIAKFESEIGEIDLEEDT